MKKILIYVVMLVLIAGCGKQAEPIKTEKKVTRQPAKAEEKKVFVKEVSSFNSEAGIEQVKLSWVLENIDDVEKIEIMTKQNGGKKYKVVKTLKADEKETNIQLYSFIAFDVGIRLIGKDGSEGNVVEIKNIVTKMERVVLDKCDDREMQIYLPEGYETSEERYPVVYMQDGQNLFNKKVAPNGEWMIDETVTKLIAEKKMGKVIIVGIYNSSKRADEYVPYDIGGSMKGQGGKASEYAEFVVNKIVPYIDGKYRTIADRENRAIMGSSFGGIFSLWTGLKHSKVFSMIGAFSPSLWVNNGYFLQELSTMEKKDVKIWLDIGSLEFDVGLCRMTVDMLMQQGYKYGRDVVYYEHNGAEHNEKAWAERAQYPLIMFKGTGKERQLTDFNLEVERCVVDYVLNIKEFIILNPIGEFDDGMKYNIYEDVEFAVGEGAKLEENVKVIFDDNGEAICHIAGNINMKEASEIEASVKYNGIEKKVRIKK